ncbi:hypothetical protein [Adonisia turfae]|uniref:Uncharacterized protein n=1 Tax=Adonisia turfae CCMR0081 TaxID=2292702 RepID=A0A6M0RE90_9CYAN|nr:hypothetical protein [Adonisia turfae]NEZ54559.1 hypothetical protein [Adonisia turfae CCMR0081]
MRDQKDFTGIIGLLLFLAALQPAQAQADFENKSRPQLTLSIEERAIELSKVLHERLQSDEKNKALSPKDRRPRCTDLDNSSDTMQCVGDDDDDGNLLDWNDWNDWSNWNNWIDTSTPPPNPQDRDE